MCSSKPEEAERTHFAMACALDGVLCLLHFDGSGAIEAEFKYKGHASELNCTEDKADIYT